MTKTAEKIPFHQHLDECQQCRENPMKLCKVGDELLTNRTYETSEISTAYCFTCHASKPEDQFETREVLGFDETKRNIKRCLTCWGRRS